MISGAHQGNSSGFYRRVIIAVIIFHLVVATLALAWVLRVLLIDVLLAVTVASAIAPLAEHLEKHKIPRVVSVALTYLVVVGFYVGMGFMLANPFREQAELFAAQLPHYTAELKDAYNSLLAYFGDNAGVITHINPEDLRTPALRLLQQTMSVTAGLMGLLLNGVLVLFLAAYFVIEANDILEKLLLWVPPENRDRARGLIRPLGARMGGYVRGQILVSTAVGAFFALGFTLIGVKYGLVLGLMAGILNLLPFVGSLIVTGIALFVASNQSMLILGLTFALFIIEQTIESNFIVPHLLGKQVDMHPLIVLFSILIGATVAGAVGALASVPLAAAVLFLAQEFYLKPINGAPTTPPQPKEEPAPPTKATETEKRLTAEEEVSQKTAPPPDEPSH